MSQLFAALKYLIAALVDQPEKVEIERVETPRADIFTISVPREEMGRLVGRGGRTAEAIRDVLGALGVTMNKEVILDVIEARDAPKKAGQRLPHDRRRAQSRSKSRRQRPSSSNAD